MSERLWLNLGWGSAALLVPVFLLDLVGISWILGAFLLVAGGALALRVPERALELLPVAMLLGPIVRVAAGPAQVQLGDAYLALLVIMLLARGDRVRIGSDAGLLGVLLLLVSISWLAARDPITTVPSMLSVAQLTLAYVLTTTYVRDELDEERLLAAWARAIALSALLVLFSYALGRRLILGGETALVAAEYEDRVDVFFRATFFVTGFVFPLAAGLVLSAAGVFFKTMQTARRLAWIVSGVVCILTVVVMANQTAMLGAAVGVVCLVLVWPDRKRAFRAAVALTVVCGTASAAVIWSLNRLGPAAQLIALRDRIGDPESLWQRLQVWQNVVNFMLLNPLVLLVGLGPDHTIRRLDDADVSALLLGGGIQQGAVDSGYLYVLVNFGVLVFAIAAFLAGRAAWRLWRRSRRSTSAATAVALIVMWLAMAVTQQHGLSKPVLLLVQLIALGSLAAQAPSASHVRRLAGVAVHPDGP